MTIDKMTFLDVLNQAQDKDFLAEVAKFTLDRLMDYEVTAQTGASYYARDEDRKNYRNGYRERAFDTRLGTLNLEIPKLREGSYFPTFLESRKRSEKALISVIQEAYVQGISTRKMDDLVKAFGMEGISKSQVSSLCQDIDIKVKAFQDRHLEGEWHYVWLDALYIKVRQRDRVISKACIVAIGVNEVGQRRILGFALKENESETFWTEFLESLKKRGLKGVQLVISDAHTGLQAAITKTLCAQWQRCWVHFMRNILPHIPKAHMGQVMGFLRLIVKEEEAQEIRNRYRRVMDSLKLKYPKVYDKMIEAEEDVLAYRHFPKVHHRKIYSNNPLERLNREIRRRTNVVGIFPNDASVLRLVGEVLHQIDEDWLVQQSYMSPASMQLLMIESESDNASI